jgi:hypothetical protein
MKNLMFLAIFCSLFSCGFAQTASDLEANKAFLSNFPDLTEKSKIDVKYCFKTLKKGSLPFEKIAAIKYQEMLYSNAKPETMKNWRIFPLGKYKISETVYLVLYFSDYMGVKRGKNELDHMLNIATLDIAKSTQISINQGNDGEYINKSEAVLGELIDMGIEKKRITRNADFVWKFVSNNSASLKSSWIYADDSKQNKDFSIFWDKEGNLKFL